MSKPSVTVSNISMAVHSGADSILAVALALGYGGTSGKVSKATLDKIEATVPDLAAKIANRTGQKASVKERVADIKTKAAASAKELGQLPNNVLTSAKVVNGNPFAFGFKRGIFDIASQSEKTLEIAVEQAAMKTGRSANSCRAFIVMMSNPHDHFNGNRTINMASGGMVKLAAIA